MKQLTQSFLTITAAAALALTLAGCTTPQTNQKHYLSVLAVASDGVLGQWATNAHAIQALDQSFTRVLLEKGYSVCPIVKQQADEADSHGVRPEVLDRLAIESGRQSKVEYVMLAVLNQATAGTGNNDEIRLNIVSKLFRLGNDITPAEVVASHEWPEKGKDISLPGGSQSVVLAIQSAAAAVAEKYPSLVDLLRGGH